MALAAHAAAHGLPPAAHAREDGVDQLVRLLRRRCRPVPELAQQGRRRNYQSAHQVRAAGRRGGQEAAELQPREHQEYERAEALHQPPRRVRAL